MSFNYLEEDPRYLLLLIEFPMGVTARMYSLLLQLYFNHTNKMTSLLQSDEMRRFGQLSVCKYRNINKQASILNKKLLLFLELLHLY